MQRVLRVPLPLTATTDSNWLDFSVTGGSVQISNVDVRDA